MSRVQVRTENGSADAGAAEGASKNAGGEDEDVVDADFEEVKDGKKGKKGKK